MTAILAIDFGLKRIGLAATDPLGLTAQPLPVVANTGAEAIERVALIARDRRAELVLVGLPLNMDGSEGPMAARVRAFVAALSALLDEGVALELRDERLTSWAAEKEEFAKGRKPWRDKGRIDTRSAMILLEDLLAERDPGRGLLPEPSEPAAEPGPRRGGRRERRDRRGRRR